MKITRNCVVLTENIKVNPQFIPLFLIMIILILPLCFSVVKKTIKKILSYQHAITIHHNKNNKLPEFSVAKLMDGSLQKKYETWINENLGFRTAFIQSSNQFLYSLFNKSHMYHSNIVIGKNDFLFEKTYIEQYVNINRINYSEKQFDQWASQLQRMADFFTQRGQQFFYVITPSKASYYPEYLPKDYAKLIETPRPDYFLKLKALKKTNVAYFDGSEYILESKDKPYAHLLFPRGGTHWTMLSAALTAREILALISRQMNYHFPPLHFSYSTSTKPPFVDKDLLNLCNLLFPKNRYVTPLVIFKSNKKPLPFKVAIIGGSFTNFYKDLFAKTRYFSQVDQYFYLNINHLQISQEGKEREIPVDKENPLSYQEILAADIVILEENEVLAYSTHFTELYSRLFDNPTFAK